MRNPRFILTLTALLVLLAAAPAASVLGLAPHGPREEAKVLAAVALGNEFTYQGRLLDGNNPAQGTYDLQFILYDAASGGSQVGVTVIKEDVPVNAGLFTTQLDFGLAAFRGEGRWLEIGVRGGTSAGTFTILSPRQQVTATPYALFAKSADAVNLPFVGTAIVAAGPVLDITNAGTGGAIKATASGAASAAVSGTGGTLGFGGTFTGGIGAKLTGATAAVQLDGAIQVTGNARPAFTHVVDTTDPGANVCDGNAKGTIIDHPMANGDEAALLFVTVKDTTPGAFDAAGDTYAVLYDSAACTGGADKWIIFSTSGTDLPAGLTFNVLIIKDDTTS